MELQELYSVAVPLRYWDVCLQLADAAGQGNRLELRDLQELWKLYLLQVNCIDIGLRGLVLEVERAGRHSPGCSKLDLQGTF